MRGRHWTIAHDCRVDARHCHRTNHRQRLDTEVLSPLRGHDDHARSTVGDLRGRTRRDRAPFRVECRLERRQTFECCVWTNGLVVVEHLQEAILVIPLHRDDFVLELALQCRLVSQLMGAQTKCILGLTGNTVHFAEHFGSQAHHP